MARPRSQRDSTPKICIIALLATQSGRAQHARALPLTVPRPNRRLLKPRRRDDAVPALRRVRLARRRLAADATQRPAAAPPAPATGGPDEKPRLRDWIGVLAMCAGLVMAIMDVQIVTSSLTQIQGGLSASSDEIAWVQTAYLIADVVMVPLSGMMSRLLSIRMIWQKTSLVRRSYI